MPKPFIAHAHINHVILAKGHPRRHLIHKYWARKPHNVIEEYIKHYSYEDEIVLDPFSGSGVTAIEALVLGRKAIAIDLNPMSAFMTEMIAKPVDIDELKDTYGIIKRNVRNKIRALYATTCKKCGGKANILVSVWQRESLEPTELRYYCPTCKKRREKPPSKEDLQRIEDINASEIPYWVPNVELRYPNGKQYREGTHIEEEQTITSLFTRRNLIALSILYHEIEAIENPEMRDFMEFGFTSMVHLASSMTPDRPTRPYSSFWSQQRYWTPQDTWNRMFGAYLEARFWEGKV